MDAQKKDFKKPDVEFSGQNRNVFVLLSICVRALKQIKRSDLGIELRNRVLSCKTYDEALNIIREYCDINKEIKYDC